MTEETTGAEVPNQPVNKGQNVHELARDPSRQKPDEISAKDWRKARMDAGHMVIIRSHFKSIYLIPMAIISAVIATFAMVYSGEGDFQAQQEMLGLIWMAGFVFYMNVFIFEWSRAWTWGFLFTVAGLVAIGFALNDALGIWEGLIGFLRELQLVFSSSAYWTFAIFFGGCALFSYIRTRLNYIVVENNEVQVYRNALFGDRERMAMPNSRVEVRVPDMLEYLHPFYRAGQIVIHTQDKSLVLDNVLNIRKIEKVTDRLGSALSVRVSQQH